MVIMSDKIVYNYNIGNNKTNNPKTSKKRLWCKDRVGTPFEISDNTPTPDRGYIEVPADRETVIYQDDAGQAYEININDLIDYDDDNEITYTPNDDNDYDARSAKTTARRHARMGVMPMRPHAHRWAQNNAFARMR